jgi:hypothetical protein
MIGNEATIQAEVDRKITRFRTTPIQYYPFVSGTPDIYGQQTKTFGTPVTLTGRAILRPTPEKLSVIGNDEQFEVAFLFARAEMLRKFPSADEGEWILSSGRLAWWSRTYKIEHVRPTGQVGEHFMLVVALANSLQGERD